MSRVTPTTYSLLWAVLIGATGCGERPLATPPSRLLGCYQLRGSQGEILLEGTAFAAGFRLDSLPPYAERMPGFRVVPLGSLDSLGKDTILLATSWVPFSVTTYELHVSAGYSGFTARVQGHDGPLRVRVTYFTDVLGAEPLVEQAVAFRFDCP
jgi:hypothetical protein